MRPDLVICESTEADVGWDERRLRYVLSRGQGFDSPLYRDVLAAAGVAPGWRPGASTSRRLQPHHREILAGVYRAMVADGRATGRPDHLGADPPRRPAHRPGRHRRRPGVMARAAGFDTVVDASDAYDGLDPARLAVEPDDFHPNPEGHARLARRLDEALGELPELHALVRGRPGRETATGPRAAGHALTPRAPEESRTDDPPDRARSAARAALLLLRPLVLLIVGLISWPAEWDWRPCRARQCAGRPGPGRRPRGPRRRLLQSIIALEGPEPGAGSSELPPG